MVLPGQATCGRTAAIRFGRKDLDSSAVPAPLVAENSERNVSDARAIQEFYRAQFRPH
jgi:hypothetical protein